MSLFWHWEINDAIRHYRGAVFLFTVSFSYFKLWGRISRVHLQRSNAAESWWSALSTDWSSLVEVIVRWHEGFMDAWCGLVRESSYPVMERLLLFSCRQSIHQLSLPNLALNEQHNPRVFAIHTHNKFSLHFLHVSCAVYNVLRLQAIKPQTGDTLNIIIKTWGRNLPWSFWLLPSLSRHPGITW